MKITRILVTIIMIVGMSVAFGGCGSTSTTSEVPDTIAFQSFDLKGNEVSSGELFGENRVTMVNFWGTFCGPCIEEMPELEKINREYKDRGAAVIGAIVDVTVNDDSLRSDAEEIVSRTGVKYTNVQGWDGFEELLPEGAVPTTYFVDSSGRILGDHILGADIEGYRKALDKYLSEAE